MRLTHIHQQEIQSGIFQFHFLHRPGISDVHRAGQTTDFQRQRLIFQKVRQAHLVPIKREERSILTSVTNIEACELFKRIDLINAKYILEKDAS